MSTVPAHEAPATVNKRWAVDAAERIGFVAAYFGVSELITLAPGVKNAYVPMIMVGLAALKSLLAKKIGPAGTAALFGLNPPVEIADPSVPVPSTPTP